MSPNSLGLVGVILPDGRIDPAGSRFVNDDVELAPIEPSQEIVEAVEDGMKTPEQLDHYLKCRANDCSRKLAACLATRSFPGVKTDAVFNEGKFSGDTGKIGHEQKWLEEQAKLHGVSTNGKWYCRGLASFPGDPTAWVDGRGDVLRIAAEKNMTVKGYVEHKGHEVDPGGDEVIADDIIENEVDDILDSNPHANAEEVRDAVYQLRTGQVDPNPLLVQD